MIVFRVDDKVHGEVEMEDIELQRAASLKSSKTASKKQAGTGADSSKSTLSSEPGDVSQRAQRAVELAQQFLAEWSSLSPEARNNDSKGIDSAKMKLLELSMDRTGLNPEERSMESPLKTGFADAAPSPVA